MTTSTRKTPNGFKEQKLRKRRRSDRTTDKEARRKIENETDEEENKNNTPNPKLDKNCNKDEEMKISGKTPEEGDKTGNEDDSLIDKEINVNNKNTTATLSTTDTKDGTEEISISDPLIQPPTNGESEDKSNNDGTKEEEWTEVTNKRDKNHRKSATPTTLKEKTNSLENKEEEKNLERNPTENREDDDIETHDNTDKLKPGQQHTIDNTPETHNKNARRNLSSNLEDEPLKKT